MEVVVRDLISLLGLRCGRLWRLSFGDFICILCVFILFVC